MKKRISFCVLLLVSVFFMTALALSENAWERDPNMHWHEDENGVKTDEGAHVLDDVVCEICQSTIWLYDDGMCDINNFNEYDELTHYSYFDADGTLIDDYVYVYKYDENGNKLTSSAYYFETLVEESEYGLDPFGFTVQKSVTSYLDDGSISAYLCDEYGNIVSSRITDAEGNITIDETYEYTYNEEGMPLYTIQKIRFDDGIIAYRETDEMGNSIIEAQYNPDGSVIFEFKFLYEYDELGRMTKQTATEDDRPLYENHYAYEDRYDLWGYQIRSIEYLEDGSKIVYEFDEYGETISETTYDAEGNIVS